MLGDDSTLITDEQRAALAAKFVAALSSSSAHLSWGGPANPVEGTETTRVTGANGAAVAVTQRGGAVASASFTLHLGEEGGPRTDVDFSGNLRVGRTEDGLYAVYFMDDDVTRTYAEDGSFTEVSGDRTDADAGRIFISTTANDTLRGGGGNDTFLVYGSSASVNTGEGDNTVIVKYGTLLGRPASCCALTTGNGNNTVTVEGIWSGAMALGDGNNTVSLRAMGSKSTLTTGNGDNAIAVDCMKGGTLTLGDGGNRVTVGAMEGFYPRIVTGNGDSALSIGKMDGHANIGGTHPASDSARRTISIGSMSGHGSIHLGFGTNTLSVGSMSGNSSVHCESGMNTMDIGSMDGEASIGQWAGEMTCNIGRMTGSAKAYCRAERTSLTIRNMDGDAYASVAGKSSVRVEEMAGAAHMAISDLPGGLLLPFDPATGAPVPYEPCTSEVFIREMRDTAALSLAGSGHTVAVAGMRDDAAIEMAESTENSGVDVFIGEADETATLPGGNAAVRVLSELEPEELDAVKTMLAGWRAEREAAGLPAASRDLWASLHGDDGKEEELLRRVAMLLPWQ